MTQRRTELHDELTALLAAARELSPDHDQALADVFIDRMAGAKPVPVPVASPAALLAQPRRLIISALLALSFLGTGSAIALHHLNASGAFHGPVASNVQVAPMTGKARNPLPAGKAPRFPQPPAPKPAP